MPHFKKPHFVYQKDPRQSAYGMIIGVSPFYLDKGDKGYDKSFKTVKNEEEGYKGEMINRMIPANKNDYNDWYNSLPNIVIQNPLLTPAIYIPHIITEEGVLWCFQWVLDETYRRYCSIEGFNKEHAKAMMREISAPIVKTSLFKTECEAKTILLNNADYSKVPNKELYKVK